MTVVGDYDSRVPKVERDLPRGLLQERKRERAAGRLHSGVPIVRPASFGDTMKQSRRASVTIFGERPLFCGGRRFGPRPVRIAVQYCLAHRELQHSFICLTRAAIGRRGPRHVMNEGVRLVCPRWFATPAP